MTNTYKALVAQESEEHAVAYQRLHEADLGEGDVTVAVEYSTVNFKDGLAITNTSPIVQKRPLVLGIDYAGTVIDSDSDRFRVGDKVVRNGFGASEYLNGGYCERARSDANLLVGLPKNLTTRAAMAIGTAGYTAMLCLLALEEGGTKPGEGEILVTGAAGGVGSVAVAILSKLGYQVVASTGRLEEAQFLMDLGAREIMDRQEISEPGKPMQRERWAGVVDCVGSHTLANSIASTRYNGVVAACGLAQGADLPATVMPFILRNVRLQGVDSVQTPLARREQAWARLSTDLDLDTLEALSFDLAFSDVVDTAPKILAGQIRGRAVVDLSR